MKRIIFTLLSFYISIMAFSQNDEKEIDYKNPVLRYRVYDNASTSNWDKIDLSKLEWTVNKKSEEVEYYFDIPFFVSDNIENNSSFVFLGGLPKHLKGWGILNENKEGVVKSFNHYTIGDIIYIVQAQENLTRNIEKGKYYLRLYSSNVYTYPSYCILSVSAMPKESIDKIKVSLKSNVNKN